jgi:hypothetical protein
LFPTCIQGQNSKHSLMLWGAAGYSTFFTKWNSFNNTGNFGSGVGFGFNFLLKEHFIISTGVEYLSLNSSVRPTNLIIYKYLVDTEDDEYTMEYALQRFVQLDRTHNIFIPIYFGYKTNLRNLDFYVVGGGKVGYMFASNSVTKIPAFTTIGIYDRFIEPFKDMPNHYFDTKKYYSTSALNFSRLQAVVSLEFGVEFPSVFAGNALRIGIFADYGVINQQTKKMQKQNKELISFEAIPNDIRISNLYETTYKSSSNTSSFFSGVKITLLLNVTKPPCPTCLPKNFSKKK